MGPVKLALQQVLAGMPERRPELVVCGRGDDQMVVVGAGRAVLFTYLKQPSTSSTSTYCREVSELVRRGVPS
jgi:hypothetical protein